MRYSDISKAEDASERWGAGVSTNAATAQAFAMGTRPEIELLLYCAQPRIDSRKAQRIRALFREGVDWLYLIRIASQHGVMPLLYQTLHTTCPQEVPQAALEQLQKLFHTNAGRNVLLTRELLTLLRLFETHGIPVVPYKGPVLAVTAYGNLALRQFIDLDLLVPACDFLCAGHLLRAQGYRLTEERGWESVFVDASGTVSVDLHHGLTPRAFPFPFDFGRVWQRRQSVCLAGTMIPTLAPEDLLLILCVQVAKDRWEHRTMLVKICDIAALLQVQQNLEWGRVLEEATHLHSQRLLFFGLRLTSELLGTTLPQDVWRSIQAHPSGHTLTAHARAWLFQEADRRSSDLFRRVWFHFRVHECWRDKLAQGRIVGMKLRAWRVGKRATAPQA